MSARGKALRAALAALALALLCAGMNALAGLVDTPRMRENAAQALSMLRDQGIQPEVIGGFAGGRLDNYTAALIVKTAAYTGPEPLMQRAFGGLRAELSAGDGSDAWSDFCLYGDGARAPTGGGLSYSRYWHGYTLPLRLLLCLLNLSNIQLLTLFAQTALLACAAVGLSRRGLSGLLPGFVAAFFLLAPPATGVCLQFAPVTLLALGGCALLLFADGAIGRAVGLPGFFLLLGMLTNYFDLLTFPLVSLGFPLVTALCLRRAAGEAPGRLFGLSVACAAAWALGYGGMWALKWLFTALFIGPEWVGGALAQVRLRVSSASGGRAFTRASVIAQNVAVVADKTALRLLLALAAALSALPPLRAAWREKKRGGLVRPDARALSLLVPLAAPLLWIAALANHCYDHTYFTYRCLAVSAYAAFALLSCALSAPTVKRPPSSR